MKIVTFKESNVTYAKDQPQYRQLPVYKTEEGNVTSCWKLSIIERLKLLITGRVYVQLMTFNQPLQPQYVTIEKDEVISHLIQS